MLHECIIAGFGGQGIMSMGQMLSYAGMKKGYNVIWLPSYGPEMRGGTAYCTVILSDAFIGSPVVSSPEFQIVMNRPSLDKFATKVKKGGQLFINSSLIDIKSERADIDQYQIPANQIAMDLENPRSGNIAMLGAFIGKSGILEIKDIQVMLEEKFAGKQDIIDNNTKILMKGYETAQTL